MQEMVGVEVSKRLRQESANEKQIQELVEAEVTRRMTARQEESRISDVSLGISLAQRLKFPKSPWRK